MRVRPATADDLAAMESVFRAAVGELFARHAFEPPSPPPGAFAAQHAHLLRHDRERCLVAEEAGAVVAFSAALVRDDTWFLSSLFVLPEHQGRGLGRRLLDASWGEGYRRRLTITDSIQPISNGLYAGRGLLPITPVLHLDGEPLVTPPSDLDADAFDVDACAPIDRAAYGFDRAVDHAYWLGGPARATMWRRDGETCAYSYAWPGGRIGPVAGSDPAAAAAALAAELARARGPAALIVPGSATALVRVAIASGLRFGKPPGLLLVDGEVGPPASLAIAGYALF